VRGDIESKIAMALSQQQYAKQLGMEEGRVQALRGARNDFVGSVSSGGQGDRDLYDNYSRNNPPRPKTGYKSQPGHYDREEGYQENRDDSYYD